MTETEKRSRALADWELPQQGRVGLITGNGHGARSGNRPLAGLPWCRFGDCQPRPDPFDHGERVVGEEGVRVAASSVDVREPRAVRRIRCAI
jgi:hypothetical protein